MISFHMDHQADVTIGTIRVPIEEASRFGVLAANNKYRITSFVEKPSSRRPTLSTWVFIYSTANLLDKVLWEDRKIIKNHPTILARILFRVC